MRLMFRPINAQTSLTCFLTSTMLQFGDDLQSRFSKNQAEETTEIVPISSRRAVLPWLRAHIVINSWSTLSQVFQSWRVAWLVASERSYFGCDR